MKRYSRTAQLIYGKIENCAISSTGVLENSSSNDMFLAQIESGKTYSINTAAYVGFFMSEPVKGNTSYDNQRTLIQEPFTAPITGYIAIRLSHSSSDLMFNEGSTSLPYAPYIDWQTKSPPKYGTATEAVENPLYSDGTAITAYTIKGNEEHTGTPSPQNPVMPNGVGNKTANLIDYTFFASTRYVTVTPITNGINLTGTYYVEISGISLDVGTKYYMSWTEEVVSGTVLAAWRVQYTDNTYSSQIPSGNALTIAKDVSHILFYVNSTNTQASVNITNLMLNTGSTALTYEPYGFKIPISTAQGSAVNYLGSVQSTRQIKKLVFDGTETGWDRGTYSFYYTISDMYIRSQVICTHYEYYDGTASSAPTNSISTASGVGTSIWIKTADHDTTTLDQWKAYLQAQYAAGTPVTIWYVLGTETTGIVNEPLMKIGDYSDSIANATAIPTTEGANSITVDTTVQPSEFTATWTGWHDSSVKEYDGSDWQ